jgi:hypothetical protein
MRRRNTLGTFLQPKPPTPPPPNPTESPLAEADRLVDGDRQSAYGHPADDFAKTAKIWTGILLPRLKVGEEVSAKDVALCMVGVKLSREVNRHKRDNLVDAAGYVKTAWLVEEAERMKVPF